MTPENKVVTSQEEEMMEGEIMIDPPVNSMSTVGALEEWLAELDSWEVEERDLLAVGQERQRVRTWLRDARVRDLLED